jgi:cyclohexyl-isocyanide hydratase
VDQADTLPDFTVGILLYANCDLLDIAGPNDVFDFFDASVIGRTSRVASVAGAKAPLGGIGAMTVTPQYDFEDCPPIDLLFVPGGGPAGLEDALADEALLAFVREKAAEARYVSSVCTGGLILAAAGLLDGYQATTHWAVIDCLRLFPEVKVVNGCPRYVHDGNRFTGGGISSSIDLSLYMVETIVTEMSGDADTGKFASQQVQLQIQYNPQPPNSGGDPCSVDYALYAPTAESMKDFHDGVCDAVRKRLETGA